MRLGLIVALAASLAMHAFVLCVARIGVERDGDPPPLMAELRPVPMPAAVAAAPSVFPAERSKPAKPDKSRRPPGPKPTKSRPASTPPVLDVPAAETFALPQDALQAQSAQEFARPAEEPAEEPATTDTSVTVREPPAPEVAVPPRLPPRGTIRYRVDRGDANFEIGYAEHRWAIADGRYRLSSVAETTGLVWLFKSVRIEMESRGRLTEAGLQPQLFSVRRNGRPGRERADFDWDAMSVRVGERDAQPLDEGAQDLLSFNYQLGYLADATVVDHLPIATGKKYEVYRFELIGDEELELPVGPVRTVHLRALGASARDSTEIWLAYDYLLLPVKIRYLDAQGASYVQLATRILVGDDAGDPAAIEVPADARQ